MTLVETEVISEETCVSVVCGTTVQIVSSMSVSLTLMPRAISPKTPPRSWKLTKRRERGITLRLLAQRRHFTPFVVSTDGLIGKEAPSVLKELSTLLSDKWEKPYSVVRGYVNARMSISIVRATHLCLRGSRIPTSQISNRRPQWEDKAGLRLFRNST
jgi:hypothetical protein